VIFFKIKFHMKRPSHSMSSSQFRYGSSSMSGSEPASWSWSRYGNRLMHYAYSKLKSGSYRSFKSAPEGCLGVYMESKVA